MGDTDADRRRKDAEDAHRRLKEEEKRKMEEKERKKAEVRKRLEEAAKAKKAGGKRGFMTPERKKKLRNLLRKKAAEELKKEQERKAGERRKIIAERVGQPKPLDGANEAALQAICKEYYQRLCKLESEKYDTEYLVRQKDYEINELTIQVNDLRGKFVKPALKKVSKFDKLKMVAKSTSEVDFRSNLKSVKKETFKLDEGKETEKKPEWALGSKKENEE
ncbi:troponin I-like isoform X2 [Dermacentor silvarum]|uniref:troponin I-like isoform X2 n=1 Tax=Dermacentor silvarum TaxID=543639 RepID=UPI001896E022|nr:troponin I-like isoform X2 [Dermacentor silvarum]